MITKSDMERMEEFFKLTETSFHEEHTHLKCTADYVIGITKYNADPDVVKAGQVVWAAIYKDINVLIEKRIERRNKWFDLSNMYAAQNGPK